MKRFYWRPAKVSRKILIIISIISVIEIALVELWKERTPQTGYNAKIAAAKLMKRGMDVIKEHRLKNIGPIDAGIDIAQSGMIGTIISPITSGIGHLPSKLTSANPNFAAVMVHLLLKAGVREGDTIAVGMSGSFPALNLATYAAAEAMKLNVIAITSITASMWGANEVELNWLKMEELLNQFRIVPCRSIAASIGGLEDRGMGLSSESRAMAREIIVKSKVQFLNPVDYADSVNKRMEIYTVNASPGKIAAYINIGGGTSSVGTYIGKHLLKPGLNKKPAVKALSIDSVMSRFAIDGVPIIHLVKIKELAEKYGLPVSPFLMPSVGEGEIFVKFEYRIWLAILCVISLIVLLFAFVRMDYGYRIFTGKKQENLPERMI